MLLSALLAGAVIAAAPAVPANGVYKGTTATGRQPVRIVVTDGGVRTATVTVQRYRCVPEGDIGPLRVAVDVAAPVRKGRFSFDGGVMPSYLKMTGTFAATGRVTGKLRAHGTIGTGDPCTSPTYRFTAKRLTSTRPR